MKTRSLSPKAKPQVGEIEKWAAKPEDEARAGIKSLSLWILGT